MEWNSSAQAVLLSMAPKSSASDIAAVLGTTRNAVLGRAHRTGVSLLKDGESPRDFSAMGRRSSGRKGKTLPLGHPSRRARPGRCAAYSLKERGAVIAAVMAGASHRTAASLVGASKVTVAKLWRHDPEVQAVAREIFARALSDARQRQAERRRLLDLQHAAAMAHNRRILSEWGERNRTIVLRRCAGESLAGIGSDYGLTRERVRQIVARAVSQGLISPPGVNIQNDRAAA